MAYATIAGVRELLSKDVRVDVSTNPGTATLTTWIGQIANTVDAAIVKGGDTVASLTADEIGAITLACNKEGAYLVLVSRGASSDKEHEPFWAKWHEEFVEMIGDLSGTTAAAAGSVASTIPPSSYTMDSPSDTDTSINPKFTRGKRY